MNLQYFLFRLWEIVVDHAIPLIALLLLAILVPRLGRLTIRIIEGRLDEEEESTKSRLALLGALVYVIQIVAFFLIILLALSNLGVPPLGAAVPATIVSAAVGFGAQSIIGDFLSGFFILSERQFGVGDYVSFDGTNSVTEGTVVALTLRATKVRTPSGEVVMIPNGSAGVITNFSQEWSRAVVNFDVPVRSGENLDEIQQTIAGTAQTAVQDPSIADDVAGDVEILPATSLTAPTAAGQPWKVNFRVLVVVNPARQWAVERGIRSALLNVFWDHFRTPFESTDKELAAVEGSKEASLSDAPTEHLPTASPTAAADTPTEIIPVDPGTSEAESSLEDTQAAAAAAEEAEQSDEDIAPTAKDDGPGRPSQTAETDAEDLEDTATEDEDAEDTKKKRHDFWRTDAYSEHWKKILSFGGRVRVSTTGLILALIFTGGLALASSNPEEGSAGVLSPDYWQQRSAQSSEEETEPAEPQDTSVDQPSYEPQPEQSVDPAPTDQQNPDDTQNYQDQYPDDSTGQTQQNSPNNQSPNQTPSQAPNQPDSGGNSGTQGTQGTQGPQGGGGQPSQNTGDGAASGANTLQVPEPTEQY